MVLKKPAPELVRNVRALFGNDRTLANLKPIKKCLAVRHVAFEDLGLLGPLVSSRGYGVRYHDAGVQPIDAETLLAPDLLIVLGGPIGVYETDTYPFIADEITAIAARLAVDEQGHAGGLRPGLRLRHRLTLCRGVTARGLAHGRDRADELRRQREARDRRGGA